MHGFDMLTSSTCLKRGANLGEIWTG